MTDDRQRVLDAVDLAALVGRTVQLRKQGGRYVGLCPFHSERSPSFHVVPDKGFYHCFGCKKSGNAIDFVIERDRLDFRAALELLAKEAGVELTRRPPRDDGEAGRRATMLDALSAAAGFYERQLRTPAGAAAREYLKQRGFTDETLKTFRAGFASSDWDALARDASVRAFKPEVLAAAGLTRPRKNGPGHTDVFRERALFPIRDEQGRVVAFGGRVLPGGEHPAKYLNSPESPVFSKGRVLFGLDLAKDATVKARAAVVVEGYTDVVMAHQFGQRNVVSALGTALTEQHVALLKRFADKVVLLFDADAAGDRAADRAVELSLTSPLDVAVATMPDGLDPDELLLKHGAAAWEKAMAAAVPAIDFMWRRMARELAQRPDDVALRARTYDGFLERLAAARLAGKVDPMRWGSVLVRVARLTGASAEELQRRFAPAASPRRTFRPKPQPTPQGPLPGNRLRAERWLVGALLHEPAWWHGVEQRVSLEELAHPPARALAERVWATQREEGELVVRDLLGTLDDAGRAFAMDVLTEAEAAGTPEQLLAEALAFFDEEKRRRDERQARVDAQQRGGAEDEEIDALRRLQDQARRPDPTRRGR